MRFFLNFVLLASFFSISARPLFGEEPPNIELEKIVVTPDGKKYELLRSAYKTVAVNFENGEMKVEVVINEDVAEKLRRMWISMKEP